MKVITARNGKALRNLASKFSKMKHIATFPEMGLTAAEQANFIKNNRGNYESIITLSPFIISDAHTVNVIDDPNISIEMGSSVNKITMMLWRKETIGEIGVSTINQLKERLKDAKSGEEIGAIIDDAYTLGDSIERTMFIHSAITKQDSLVTSIENS